MNFFFFKLKKEREPESKTQAKEGYLLKKSLHKLDKYMGWEKRYVVLKHKILTWSKSNINLEIRNRIDLETVEKLEKLGKRKFIIVNLYSIKKLSYN